jgi:hypothetical protein
MSKNSKYSSGKYGDPADAGPMSKGAGKGSSSKGARSMDPPLGVIKGHKLPNSGNVLGNRNPAKRYTPG